MQVWNLKFKSKFGFLRTQFKVAWINKLILLKQVNQILSKQKTKNQNLNEIKATSKKMEWMLQVKKVKKSIPLLNI